MGPKPLIHPSDKKNEPKSLIQPIVIVIIKNLNLVFPPNMNFQMAAGAYIKI